jgi:hypothetical protein
MIATNSFACHQLGITCSVGALGLSPDAGTRPSSPSGVPGTKTGPPSLGASAVVSFSSQIEGL